MKNTSTFNRLATTTTTLGFFLFFLGLGAIGQNHYRPLTTGSVNFTLDHTTLTDTHTQTITLYGCNTKMVAGNRFWRGPKSFEWNEPNQVLSGIPYGHQLDSVSGDSFYVSKYYIASPPVIKQGASTGDPNTLYNIGLVRPDTVVLDENAPVRKVTLDYDLLQLMYIEYIHVEFDTSFERLSVDLIPFRVECRDFPWRTGKGMKELGASGIGELNRKDTTTLDSLFLPYYYISETGKGQSADSAKKYLDCRVTILNDILFQRNVSFIVNGVPQEYIDLKAFRDEHPGERITLRATARTDLPSGCMQSRPQGLPTK